MHDSLDEVSSNRNAALVQPAQHLYYESLLVQVQCRLEHSASASCTIQSLSAKRASYLTRYLTNLETLWLVAFIMLKARGPRGPTRTYVNRKVGNWHVPVQG